jgi:hypothetical protein
LLPQCPLKTLAAFVIIVAAVFAWHYSHRPLAYPPGVLIPLDPEQTDTADAPFTCGNFTLKPLAHLALDARLLRRKIYRFDHRSSLVPIDLALGWGPMSDQRVLDRINISQSMRFYWFEYKMPPPISKDDIISHSTNMHIIPSSSAIASRCKSLRTGALVHLDGDLVEATAPGQPAWRSSLTRTDTGNGACELIWLKEISQRPDSAPR